VLLSALGAYLLYRRRLSKKSPRGNETPGGDEKWNTELPTAQYPQELQGNPLAVQSELPAEASSYSVQSPKELSSQNFDRKK
jgi:hypothetical protein